MNKNKLFLIAMAFSIIAILITIPMVNKYGVEVELNPIMRHMLSFGLLPALLAWAGIWLTLFLLIKLAEHIGKGSNLHYYALVGVFAIDAINNIVWLISNAKT
jgi:hypothetical protein